MTAPTHAELIAALRIVNEHLPLSDAIHQVRDSARVSDPDFEGSYWDHPSVLAYAFAVEVIEKALSESEG